MCLELPALFTSAWVSSFCDTNQALSSVLQTGTSPSMFPWGLFNFKGAPAILFALCLQAYFIDLGKKVA